MILLDGKTLSKKILSNIKESVSKLDKKPHLVVILVGEDDASKIYVRNKQKAALEIGITSTVIELPSTISEANLLTKIEELNKNDDVTCILVQLPLPKHIDKNNYHYMY